MCLAAVFHLAFANHVHQFDAAQEDAGTVNVLEPHHRSGAPFDGPVILLNQVVQILRLANPDGRFPLRVERLQRGQIRSAFIDGRGPGCAVLVDRLLEVAPGGSLVAVGAQLKINSVARAVDRPVKVLPLAADLHVGLVHAPAPADRPFATAE